MAGTSRRAWRARSDPQRQVGIRVAVGLDANGHQLDVAELVRHEAVAGHERVRVAQLFVPEAHAEPREPLPEALHYATAAGSRFAGGAAGWPNSRLGSHGIIARRERPTRSSCESCSFARVARSSGAPLRASAIHRFAKLPSRTSARTSPIV